MIDHWLQLSAGRRRLQWFGLAVGFLVATSLLYIPFRVEAACTDPNQVHMFLFWDPTSSYTFPSSQGWQLVNTYNGRFIRGEAPANFGQTGGDGSRPFSPSVTVTVSTPNENGIANNGNNGTQSSITHTHPAPTYNLGADNNGDPSNPDVPAFRTLQLMEYMPSSGACLPSSIPAGAIALFNSTTLPTKFVAYNADNGKTLRVDSTVHSGGGDTVTNTVSNISGLSVDPNAATDETNRATFILGNNMNTSPAATHTHGPPSPNYFTTTPVSSLPPYVQPVMGQATADIPTLSINIVALFDADPGPSWSILSNPGGQYYQKFVRPGTDVNLSSQGSDTHTAPSKTVVSGPATPADTTIKGANIGLTFNLATVDHTHNITFDFGSVSNIPPYVNFVIAQKVSFVMMSFRWYVDPPGVTGTQNTVSDPWPSGSSVDIAPDMVLPAVPAPYRPPDANEQTQLRLRAQILVAGKPLPANGTSFRLQYQATSLNDCLSGDWQDVGSGDWHYGTNGLTDGAQLGGTSIFTAPSSTVLQTFSKSDGGGTALNAAATGALMEYDWLIQDTGAQSGTQYYFRVVESDGTPLGSYIITTTFKAECPGITTRPGLDQELRHGEFFLTNPNAGTQDPDQGFEWAD